VAGAGLGKDSLAVIRKISAKKFIFLGVEFPELVSPHLDFLKTSKLFVRTQDAQRELETHGLKSHLVPDISFSSHGVIKGKRFFVSSDRKKQRVLAINVANLFSKRNGAEMVGEKGFVTNCEVQISRMDIWNGYVKLMRNIALSASSAGIRVIHLPFADVDILVAGTIFRGIDVRHYGLDIGKAIAVLANSDLFIPTRFHATILGLKSSALVKPIVYMPKNRELMRQIDADEFWHNIPWQSLAQQNSSFFNLFSQAEPIQTYLLANKLSVLKNSVEEAFGEVLETISHAEG
jgi:polysaccharide pyruvyl transferase WcaK-like protein